MGTTQQRFATIVNALSADMYRYAYLLCHNETLAEDLVQETFMRAWRHLHSLRDEKKVKSWLITILRREYARQFERYQPEFEDIELDRLPARPNDKEPAEVLALRREIAALPLKYREALMLQIVGGYSGAEIAQLLDLPRATVNTRLFRARQQLRKVLEDDGTRQTRSRDAI